MAEDKKPDQTILLVEDDFYIREMYQKALELKGFIVRLAEDGAEAIKMFDEEMPDIVLLDIMLPTVSGLAVLKHVKAMASKGKDIPVIMITNLDSEEAVAEAKELGADDYWVKSFTAPTDAAAAVQEMMKEKK